MKVDYVEPYFEVTDEDGFFNYACTIEEAKELVFLLQALLQDMEMNDD